MTSATEVAGSGRKRRRVAALCVSAAAGIALTIPLALPDAQPAMADNQCQSGGASIPIASNCFQTDDDGGGGGGSSSSSSSSSSSASSSSGSSGSGGGD
jgi:hypothetical protein